jgi:hypothetical protein
MTAKPSEAPVDFNPHNTREIDYEKDLGAPGEFPYTRGIYPTCIAGRLWTMRQYAGYATAEESNARYKYLLAHGTTGLSVAFDLPTQIGLDSDDPLAPVKSAKSASRSTRSKTWSGCLRHSARRSLDLDDDQRHGCDPAVAVSRGGAQAERFVRQSQRHVAKRHPEGIHRARHLHLSARAVAAFGDRHLRLLRARSAKLEHDLDQRLSHSRSRLDRGAGSCVHARRRHHLRRSGARAGLESTSSRRAFLSSSTRTTICSRRSRSFARRDACGRASCAIVSKRAIRVR